MKIRKKMKRLIALLLAVTMTVPYPGHVLAASQGIGADQVMSFRVDPEAEKREREAAWKANSPLYNKLIQSGGKPKPITKSLADEGADWAGAFMEAAEQEGVSKVLEKAQEEADYQSKHLWRGNKAYYDKRDTFKGIAKCMEIYGAALNITDALTKVQEVLDLQGDTVEEQLAELVLLTAEFGVAAFSVIGMSLGFPLGLFLSFLLNLLKDGIRNGAFDWLLDRNHGDAAENQRYKLPDGTNVYKPNIYIYSDQKREVTVTFEEPELLTVTIPEYKDGWRVTVDEENRLTDEAGLNYDYLFYESLTEPSVFQTENGWRIPAGMRKEYFEKILSALRFNERETADFTEFWTEKLDQDADYIMYPQSTGLVDLAMPMSILEKPKSTERIWFVFVKDDGRKIEEPVGYELDRGGMECPYYVIEWGGLIL